MEAEQFINLLVDLLLYSSAIFQACFSGFVKLVDTVWWHKPESPLSFLFSGWFRVLFLSKSPVKAHNDQTQLFPHWPTVW